MKITHLIDRSIVEGNSGGSVVFCRERLSRIYVGRVETAKPFHTFSTFATEVTCLECLARAVNRNEQRAVNAESALADLRAMIKRLADDAEEIEYAQGYRTPYISKLVHASDLIAVLDGVLS